LHYFRKCITLLLMFSFQYVKLLAMKEMSCYNWANKMWWVENDV
jgi:hypothetical protein